MVVGTKYHNQQSQDRVSAAGTILPQTHGFALHAFRSHSQELLGFFPAVLEHTVQHAGRDVLRLPRRRTLQCHEHRKVIVVRGDTCGVNNRAGTMTDDLLGDHGRGMHPKEKDPCIPYRKTCSSASAIAAFRVFLSTSGRAFMQILNSRKT